MSTSIQKRLWASAAFMARDPLERKAYRAARKAERIAAARTPEAIAEQAKITAYHAAWVAAGMPKE